MPPENASPENVAAEKLARGIGPVPEITTAQTAVHPKLEQVVTKHLSHGYRRPPVPWMREHFEAIYAAHRHQKIILDTGCGRGHSTRLLAQANPDHMVLGLDKSVQRLNHLSAPLPENAHLYRVELVDFWLLARAHDWVFDQVYLLYPNPWPKAMHLQRRWQGHAVFPSILATAQQLCLRTNWQVYAEEFAIAATLAGRAAQGPEALPLHAESTFMSAFERKYVLTGQPVYEVTVSGRVEGLAKS